MPHSPGGASPTSGDAESLTAPKPGHRKNVSRYRIVQESLSNALRHSGSDRARVAIWASDGRVAAVVEDEGRGFEASKASADGGGLGLVGMQERAVMLGGRVLVDSTPGVGTRVRIELPTSPVEATHV